MTIREIVPLVRAAGGDFRWIEKDGAFLVEVSLPVPGTTNLSAYAEAPVENPDSDMQRDNAAWACYRACKAKLASLSDSTGGVLSEYDVEMLHTQGIRW